MCRHIAAVRKWEVGIVGACIESLEEFAGGMEIAARIARASRAETLAIILGTYGFVTDDDGCRRPTPMRYPIQDAIRERAYDSGLPLCDGAEIGLSHLDILFVEPDTYWALVVERNGCGISVVDASSHYVVGEDEDEDEDEG